MDEVVPGLVALERVASDRNRSPSRTAGGRLSAGTSLTLCKLFPVVGKFTDAQALQVRLFPSLTQKVWSCRTPVEAASRILAMPASAHAPAG